MYTKHCLKVTIVFLNNMNELIISVGRERMVPVRLGLIDYPNEQFENQLYRIAVFVAQSILDSYSLFLPWNCDEEDTLSLALKHNFPQDWLDIALLSPNFHFKLKKIITSYRFNLTDLSVQIIQQVVEFLCYEIIETAVILSNFQSISDISAIWIKNAIESDLTLSRIVKKQRITIVNHPRLCPGIITIENIDLSNKAMRLLRIFVEEFIMRIVDSRSQNNRLRIEDIQKYFNCI